MELNLSYQVTRFIYVCTIDSVIMKWKYIIIIQPMQHTQNILLKSVFTVYFISMYVARFQKIFSCVKFDMKGKLILN